MKLKDLPLSVRASLRGPQAPANRSPAPAYHPARVSDKPGAMFLTVPIRTANPNNGGQENRWVVKNKRDKEKQTMAVALMAAGVLPALPVDVRLCRLGKGNRPMDEHDGLRSSMKYVMDSIALAYGIDDGNKKLIGFDVGQRTREPEYGVEITITTRREP